MLTINASPYSPFGLDGILLCEAYGRCRDKGQERQMSTSNEPAAAGIEEAQSRAEYLDAAAIRRRNLQWLVEHAGGPAAFGEAIKREPNYITQLQADYKPFGSRIARHIEGALGKPRGWMDTPQWSATWSTEAAPVPRAAAHSDRPLARDRQRPLRVVVSDDERAEIERLANVAGMSVSAYLRTAGLNHPIRSTFDYDAVRELAQVAGDLGRLGGLLKLWLTEKKGLGQGVRPIDVERLLRDTRALQNDIRNMMGRV